MDANDTISFLSCYPWSAHTVNLSTVLLWSAAAGSPPLNYKISQSPLIGSRASLRLGYYLGGFSIGLIVLAFFLSGKKASSDYGTITRTIKNISNKEKQYSEDAKFFILTYRLDTLQVNDLIRNGEVDFSKSKTVVFKYFKLININEPVQSKLFNISGFI